MKKTETPLITEKPVKPPVPAILRDKPEPKRPRCWMMLAVDPRLMRLGPIPPEDRRKIGHPCIGEDCAGFVEGQCFVYWLAKGLMPLRKPASTISEE